MKIANMSLDWDERIDLETILREVKETGFDGCEVRLTAGWMGMPDRVKDIVKRSGCEIFCIGTESSPPDETHWYMDLIKRQIEYADALDVRKVMFFPPLRPWGRKPTADEFSRYAQACEKLAQYGAKYDITVSFHHHSHYLVETIAESEIILNQTEKLRICLDCYHSHIFEEDFVEAYRKWQSRVDFVHVHDGNGLKLKDLGEGIIPIKESLDGIKALGYDGWIATHGGQTDRSPKEKSRVCREYLRSIGY